MRGTIRVLASLINYSRLLVSVLDEIKAILHFQKKAHPMLVLSYTCIVLHWSSLKMGEFRAPPDLAFHLALYPNIFGNDRTPPPLEFAPL